MKFLKYLLALVFLLMTVFFIKGLLTPSINYENQIIVEKPANEAWAVMSDETNLPKWIKGFKRSELVSGEANTVGAVSKIYVEDNGKEMIMEETIKKVIPNKQLSMGFTMDFMNMDYDLMMNENDGKTTITTKSITKGNGLVAKSIVSFMKGTMKSQEDNNLESLKKLIEENTKNYFPNAELEMGSVKEMESENAKE